MTTVGRYTKSSTARLDYQIDWSSYLGTDTIATSSWSVPSELSEYGVSSSTTTTTTVYLSGGLAGKTYDVINTITTAGGRTDTRSLSIFIEITRSGMKGLIEELRGMTAAGTADYSIAGAYYWTDEQLQREIDKTQYDWRMVSLTPLLRYTGAGSVQYNDYLIPDQVGYWLEDAVGGTAVWRVFNSQGSLLGTANYSVNMQQRSISFTNNTFGSAIYLDTSSYDLNRAAANVWRWKAARVANRVDWSSDNHNVRGSQERQACLDMARYYSNLSGVQVTYLSREDEA